VAKVILFPRRDSPTWPVYTVLPGSGWWYVVDAEARDIIGQHKTAEAAQGQADALNARRLFGAEAQP